MEVHAWEEANVCPFDSARKGGGALNAALFRNLTAEVALLCGQDICAAFADYRKYFDHVNLHRLNQKAIQEGFPLPVLLLALQQHSAQRIIQAQGYLGKPIALNTSILAGCKFAVALTRVFFASELNALQEDHPGVAFGVHVDDTPIVAVGASTEVAENIANATEDFVARSETAGSKCFQNPY